VTLRRAVPGPEGAGRRAPPRGVDVKQPLRARPPRGRDTFPGSWGPGTPPGSGAGGSGIRDPGSGIREDPPRQGGGAPGSPGTGNRDPAGVAFTSTPRGGALSSSREPRSRAGALRVREASPGGPWPTPPQEEGPETPRPGYRAPARGVDVKPPPGDPEIRDFCPFLSILLKIGVPGPF